MRVFDTRRVTQEPTFQFHIELTAEEIRRIQSDLRVYTLPGSCRFVLERIVDRVDARKKS